jgi:hypothetical protein
MNTLPNDTAHGFALYEPETGIDVDAIASNRGEIERRAEEANAAIETSHGSRPFECRRVIVTLEP